MVKGLPLISLLLTRTWSLCTPRASGQNDTLYLEGGVASTTKCDNSDKAVSEASVMSFSLAVTLIFCWSEHRVPLESTRTCVRWLAVAECRPGPLTWHVYCCVRDRSTRKRKREK